MNGASGNSMPKHQATMPTGILRVVLNNGTFFDDLMNFMGRYHSVRP